jgi:hypothetical protein
MHLLERMVQCLDATRVLRPLKQVIRIINCELIMKGLMVHGRRLPAWILQFACGRHKKRFYDFKMECSIMFTRTIIPPYFSERETTTSSPPASMDTAIYGYEPYEKSL